MFLSNNFPLGLLGFAKYTKRVLELILFFDKKSLKLLSESYEFVHSGLRGNNLKAQKLFYRDATNTETKTTRLKAFLLGNADFIYKNKFKTLKSFLIDTI